MKLTEEQYSIVYEEALKQFPKEAVLILTEDGEVIPLENTHPNPTEQFRVSAYDVSVKYKTVALIHSHPIDLLNPKEEFAGFYVDYRMPSKSDMQTQQALDIPFGIVSCDGQGVSEVLWFPDDESSLTGQHYIPNVYDCYRIVRAYYWQQYGLKIGDHPRSFKWWQEDPSMFLNTFKDYGWYEIPLNEIEPGDLLLMRLIKNYESHAAIYLGSGKIIHHMSDELSREDQYSKYQNIYSRALRYKDKP